MYNVEIQKLFGTPLMQVPLSNTPAKLKTWQLIGGAVILGLAAYGLHCMYTRYIESKAPVLDHETKS